MYSVSEQLHRFDFNNNPLLRGGSSKMHKVLLLSLQYFVLMMFFSIIGIIFTGTCSLNIVLNSVLSVGFGAILFGVMFTFLMMFLGKHYKNKYDNLLFTLNLEQLRVELNIDDTIINHYPGYLYSIKAAGTQFAYFLESETVIYGCYIGEIKGKLKYLPIPKSFYTTKKSLYFRLWYKSEFLHQFKNCTIMADRKAF